MVVDYERAWVRLSELAASKPQHGREGLLVAMADIAAECRVPGGELSRLLRLYGVEVERARALSTKPDRYEPGAFDGGASSPLDAELAGHHRTEEVHDGGSDRGRGRRDGRVSAAVGG